MGLGRRESDGELEFDAAWVGPPALNGQAQQELLPFVWMGGHGTVP